jgi:hypothetical protein
MNCSYLQAASTSAIADDQGGGQTVKDMPLSRRKFIGAGALGTLGLLLAPETVLANDEEAELLRWDMVAVTQGVVLPGGQDMAHDAASGDTVTLTGSGQALPPRGTATGGGTFVHRHADGSVFAQGVYHVTGFNSFMDAGGSLVGAGPIDGIGTLEQTTGGILSLAVTLMPSGGASHDGVLGINCHLPGSEFPVEEGVTLSVGPFAFKQAGGGTVFHVLLGANP